MISRDAGFVVKHYDIGTCWTSGHVAGFGATTPKQCLPLCRLLKDFLVTCIFATMEAAGFFGLPTTSVRGIIASQLPRSLRRRNWSLTLGERPKVGL